MYAIEDFNSEKSYNSPMDFTIRTAVSDDIDDIMKIESEGFIPSIQEKRSVFEKRILLCPQLFLIFEETGSHKAAGYLCAEIMNKIPTCAQEIALNHQPEDFLQRGTERKCENSHFLSVPLCNCIYISSFSILPQFRGQGNGGKLWNQSLDFLKNCTLNSESQNAGKSNSDPYTAHSPVSCFILLVNDLWKGARHIYEKSGFKQINVFKDFFPAESNAFSDGILMKKDLN